MIRALLASFFYLMISAYFALWPAFVIGILVHAIKPDWEIIAFGVVFSYAMTELIFRRKGNWLS